MVIDSVQYPCEWVKNSLTLTADIVNGDNSGRLQGNKAMYLDYVGTFFNYKGQICRTKACTDTQWYNIFKVLANPINKHRITLPFGEQIIRQEIYISQVEWKLISRPQINNSIVDADTGYIKRGYKWDRVIAVQFVAIKPMWLAGGSIDGLG